MGIHVKKNDQVVVTLHRLTVWHNARRLHADGETETGEEDGRGEVEGGGDAVKDRKLSVDLCHGLGGLFSVNVGPNQV